VYSERSWRSETPGVAVRGGCSVGLDALAEPHATVAAVIGAARDVTARTAPGVEQSLCAAAALSGDPRMVSAAAFDALATTLREEAAFAFAERERAVLTDASARCALTLASNLIAVARSGCFSMTEADLDAFGNGVVEATARAASARARSLVPGASEATARGFSFRATGVALDALALDPTVAVGGGFPATLALDDGVAFDAKTFASVTVDADPDAVGEAFLAANGADAAAAAFLTSFRGVAANPVDGTLSFDTETFFDAGFAPTHAWFHDADDRLASDLTALRLESLAAPEERLGGAPANATAATAALLAAVEGANVTLGFDVSLKPANKFGRVATVRYFDASVAAVSAAREREKAENAEALADAADRWAEYQITNPVVNGSFANGTNVTWPPPPAPSPPPPRYDLPPAPREGTGVPLGTGWVDHGLVEGSSGEIGSDPATNTRTAARFAPLPGAETLFAALLTNAAAPPPPSPPPPPLPPPSPPPPLPPPAPSPPKPKSYALEIILGSVFGSLLVVVCTSVRVHHTEDEPVGGQPVPQVHREAQERVEAEGGAEEEDRGGQSRGHVGAVPAREEPPDRAGVGAEKVQGPVRAGRRESRRRGEGGEVASEGERGAERRAAHLRGESVPRGQVRGDDHRETARVSVPMGARSFIF
jgi:hypothetical protein